MFCLLAALFLLSGCKAPSDSAPEEEPLRPEFLESPEGPLSGRRIMFPALSKSCVMPGRIILRDR